MVSDKRRPMRCSHSAASILPTQFDGVSHARQQRVAAVRDGPQPPLASGQDRPHRRRRLQRRISRSGSIFDRGLEDAEMLADLLGTQASVEEALKAFDAARRPKAESLQRAASASRQLVRACRSAHRHAVRAVRVRTTHRQHAHHLRAHREGCAGAGAQRRRYRLSTGRRQQQSPAAADVRTDHVARADHPQPRGGVADVHVFGQGRHRERLAPRASRQPRRRRRRPRDRRDDRRAAGRPHQPALRRNVCARACRRMEARHRLHPRTQRLQGRRTARACRPQGIADALLGRPQESLARPPTGRSWRRRQSRSRKAGRRRAR